MEGKVVMPNANPISEKVAMVPTTPSKASIVQMTAQEVRRYFDTAYKALQVSFITIAYLLCFIRDKKLYGKEEFGNHSSIEEFAEEEYGIRKTQTYNYIKIWKLFGNPEYPMQVRDEYKGYSMTQLLVYKDLNDEGKQAVDPSMSVRTMKEYLTPRSKTNKKTEISPVICPVGASFQSQIEHNENNRIVWSEQGLTLDDLIDMLDNREFLTEANLDINLYTFDIQARYVEPVTEQKAV